VGALAAHDADRRCGDASRDGSPTAPLIADDGRQHKARPPVGAGLPLRSGPGFAGAARKFDFGFNKGTRISVLDDPEGNPWVMKPFSLITFPDQKFDEIATLGSRLKLPAGWKFR
jgi:hypothetical protein